MELLLSLRGAESPKIDLIPSIFSATGIPEERMELDEMQLAYPFLCTKVNPSFIVHLGLVWGKRLYSMS